MWPSKLTVEQPLQKVATHEKTRKVRAMDRERVNETRNNLTQNALSGHWHYAGNTKVRGPVLGVFLFHLRLPLTCNLTFSKRGNLFCYLLQLLLCANLRCPPAFLLSAVCCTAVETSITPARVREWKVQTQTFCKLFYRSCISLQELEGKAL